MGLEGLLSLFGVKQGPQGLGRIPGPIGIPIGPSAPQASIFDAPRPEMSTEAMLSLLATAPGSSGLGGQGLKAGQLPPLPTAQIPQLPQGINPFVGATQQSAPTNRANLGMGIVGRR